ncbi:MAG: hypothetical protein ACOZBW_00055 [Thermodesulfobacteriota bacterium]
MPLIDLSDYTVRQAEVSLEHIDLSVSSGECWFVFSDHRESAGLFFAALATLVRPADGTYRFRGTVLDFSNYQNLLSFKKKIGYVSPRNVLLSNRTILENLLLPRYFEENSLSLALDKKAEEMCVLFHIRNRLDQKVTEANHWDLRLAMAVREFSKNPDVLLVEWPEEVVPPDRQWMFVNLLQQALVSGTPLVIFSRDRAFCESFSASGKITIKGEKVSLS